MGKKSRTAIAVFVTVAVGGGAAFYLMPELRNAVIASTGGDHLEAGGDVNTGNQITDQSHTTTTIDQSDRSQRTMNYLQNSQAMNAPGDGRPGATSSTSAATDGDARPEASASSGNCEGLPELVVRDVKLHRAKQGNYVVLVKLFNGQSEPASVHYYYGHTYGALNDNANNFLENPRANIPRSASLAHSSAVFIEPNEHLTAQFTFSGADEKATSAAVTLPFSIRVGREGGSFVERLLRCEQLPIL